MRLANGRIQQGVIINTISSSAFNTTRRSQFFRRTYIENIVTTVYPKKYAHGYCFAVVIHWLIFPYPSGLLHWHCGNPTIAPVPAKQPWWIWINTSCEFIMNDCITTTKQSTTKPCAYFLGYTVWSVPCVSASAISHDIFARSQGFLSH